MPRGGNEVDMRTSQAKPYDIPKSLVWEAYRRSRAALKAKSAELRAMRIHRRTNLTLRDLARWLNPIVAG